MAASREMWQRKRRLFALREVTLYALINHIALFYFQRKGHKVVLWPADLSQCPGRCEESVLNVLPTAWLCPGSSSCHMDAFTASHATGFEAHVLSGVTTHELCAVS